MVRAVSAGTDLCEAKLKERVGVCGWQVVLGYEARVLQVRTHEVLRFDLFMPLHRRRKGKERFVQRC